MTPPAARTARAGPADPAAADEVRFAARVELAKDEVFEVCATLALAERVLHRLGRPLEALGAARAFELMEARLGGVPPGSV